MRNPNFIRYTTGNGKKFNLYPTYINGRTPNEEDMEMLKKTIESDKNGSGQYHHLISRYPNDKYWEIVEERTRIDRDHYKKEYEMILGTDQKLQEVIKDQRQSIKVQWGIIAILIAGTIYGAAKIDYLQSLLLNQ